MLWGQGTAETHCQGREISGNEAKGGVFWGGISSLTAVGDLFLVFRKMKEHKPKSLFWK